MNCFRSGWNEYRGTLQMLCENNRAEEHQQPCTNSNAEMMERRDSLSIVVSAGTVATRSKRRTR